MKKIVKKPVVGITLDRETAPTYAQYPWYALRENYGLAVEKTGGVPLFLPPLQEHISCYLDMLDGLLIPGNDADISPQLYGSTTSYPIIKTKDQRTEFELKITKEALDRDLPVLGICNGLQIINVLRGGTLIQHIPDYKKDSLVHEQTHPKHEPTHTLVLKEDTLLYRIMNKDRIQVNSTHHQAVEHLGTGLKLNAWAEDGIVEGIEATDQKFCLGVQWHPEYLTTPFDHALFKAFMKACCP